METATRDSDGFVLLLTVVKEAEHGGDTANQRYIRKRKSVHDILPEGTATVATTDLNPPVYLKSRKNDHVFPLGDIKRLCAGN